MLMENTSYPNYEEIYEYNCSSNINGQVCSKCDIDELLYNFSWIDEN